MPTSVIQGDLHVSGRVTSGSLTLPSGVVSNAQIASGTQIDASKSQQQRVVHYALGGPASTVTADQKVVHVIHGAGAIAGVTAALITPPTTTDTVTVDIKKGNATTAFTSVLSSVITFSNTSIVRDIQDGSVATPTVADGDLLLVVVTATGTSAEGLVVSIVVNEAAVL